MKNYLLVLTTLCLVIIFSSCKKSSSNQPVQSVTWKIDPGAEQSTTDISFIRLLGVNIIYATKDTITIFVSMSSTNAGTYTSLNSTAGFGIKFGSVQQQYTNYPCSVSISSNNNNKLTGNFTAGGGSFTISGTFNNVGYY